MFHILYFSLFKRKTVFLVTNMILLACYLHAYFVVASSFTDKQ